MDLSGIRQPVNAARIAIPADGDSGERAIV
jgi:hypothetical protein